MYLKRIRNKYIMENLNINTTSVAISSSIENIIDLFTKYNENPYILHRLQTYLTNLPNMLETENKRHEERVTRINELTMEQENFYKVFLSKHQYYHMPYNNIFYEYDGKTYKIIKEDDIHHNLLSTITDEGKLMVWKHKTKQNIIKKIKERLLFKSVPETYTIQNVFGFLNTIFETKIETKYFLTVIGDCILKKTEHGSLMFFTNSNTKKLVSFIDSIAYITTGNSIMSNFISKYHESHNLSMYRLIKTNDKTNTVSSDLIKDVLNKIGIDLLCVAAHYSDRYNNSDQFLSNLPNMLETEDPVKKYVMFFSVNNMDKIISDFINQCIEPIAPNTSNTSNTLNTLNTLNTSTNTYNLSWNNMHYIWKLYLSNINVPNMIYSNNLKTLLKTRLPHSEIITSSGVSDIIFTNVTSKFLPSVSNFLSFWEKHITILNNDNIFEDNFFDDEYEIDEILYIYKLTNKNLNINISVSEEVIIKMICHYFYPQVEVIDNKYITNIHCNLWSKQDDINEMLYNYKEQKKGKIAEDSTLISFDDLYQSYKSYFQAKIFVNKVLNPIVSKHFFEKFLSNNLAMYIKFDKFVSSEWLQN
jgi:hypothetical protein